jgi:hypothetical protein
MMELLRYKKRDLRYLLCAALVLGMSAMLTGCGGASATPPASLPTTPVAGQVNSYVGGQGNSPSQASEWSVTINRSTNTYSYTNPNSGSTAPTVGALTNPTGGFLILLDQNGYQSGLALEIPGEAILLRPGDSTSALVYAVQQSTCFAITGNVKFLFDYSPGLTGTNEASFGRIYASTNSDGSAWQFNNQTEYVAPDGSVPSDADFPGYPSGYSGNCSASNGAASVASAPLSYFYNGPAASTYTVPTEYVISPAGFFFENQSYANVPASAGWNYPDISAWGVSEPSAPVTLNSVAAASYVGFLLEASVDSSIYRTRLVGFGNAPLSGTTMTGGTFPNEDPTQPVTVNMSVTFGTQDPLNNGLYYLAKLSIPYDGGQSNCATPVPSENGTLTCTYDAVATVGFSNEQHAIVLSAFDASGDQKTLVLFQQ